VVITRHLPKADALPDCATPRALAGQRVIGISAGRSQEQKRGDSGFSATKRHQKCHQIPALFLAAALPFDPHVLLLSWSAERQETVAATSRATCEAARDAIAAGRWLADDPPAAIRCERGSVFAPGSDCISGYNCR
jgi:hypothetical protein